MSSRRRRGRTAASARAPRPARTSAGPDPASAPARLPWIAWCIPPLLAVGVYLNALHNAFVYDDFRTVVNNPSLRDLGNLEFVLRFERFRPLINLSYAIDYRLWQTNPVGYHLTSLALHALNVLLFSLFVARLLRHRPGAGDDEGRPTAVALAAAAVLAVHPLMTEAVGFISGRSEVLCATFFMAALLAFQRFMTGGGRVWVALGVIGWLLSLAAKEVGGMLPFVLLGYDLVLLDRADRRRRWWLHLPLLALVVAGGVGRVVLYLAEEPSTSTRPWRHLQTQFGVTWRYLRLFVLPTGQSLIHAVPQVQRVADPLALFAGAALAALTGLAWKLRRRWPHVTFGWAWFLLVLTPTALIPLREPMAEHRVYLASFGLMIAVTALGAHALRWTARAQPRAAAALKLGGVAVLAALASATVLRNRAWETPLSVMEDALAKRPDAPVIQRMTGDEYLHAGRCQDAIPLYERAVARRSRDRDLRNNLGICLLKVRRFEEARQVLTALVAAFPDYPRARKNLGFVALEQQRPQEALAHFEQVLRLDPKDAVARRHVDQLRARR